MASDLAQALIVAKQRLQQIVATAVATAWQGLPHHDQQQVDEFLAAALPVAAAANRHSVALTEAFLAKSLGRQPVGVNADEIIAGIRNGTTPADVYFRSFVTTWAALGSGVPYLQAVKTGMDRARSAAATDVQLSFTHTLVAVGTANDRIVGFQRVPDATACDFCLAATGQVYHSGDLMPLHSGCGCGVEPIMQGDLGSIVPAPTDFPGPEGIQVAVREHGELGPVLTNAADAFTGPAAIPA